MESVTPEELEKALEMVATKAEASDEFEQFGYLSIDSMKMIVNLFGGRNHLLKNDVDRVATTAIITGIEAGLEIAAERARVDESAQS